MIKRLRQKFVLITMALVAVVLVAVFAGINIYYAGSLRTDGYRMLEQAAQRPHGDAPPNFQLDGRVPEGFGRDPSFVVQVDAGGTATLLSAERIDVDAAEVQDIAQAALTAGHSRGELRAYGLRYLVDTRGGRTTIAFMPLSFEHQQLRSVMLVSGLGVGGALVVFFIAGLLLSRWALRPVEQAWDRQKRFVADASHELKTPLTVILANTGILKSHPEDTVAAQMTWVDNTQAEATRMKGLVEDMLFLAKGDDVSIGLPMADVDLSETAGTAALAFEPLAFEHGRKLETNVAPGIHITGNAGQLKQLAGILLDNAIKYSAENGTITLSLEKKQARAELCVSNPGEALDADTLGRLFDRFYRADPARAEGGYGLGLSIARMIVTQHKGRIAAESSQGITRFAASFPIRE